MTAELRVLLQKEWSIVALSVDGCAHAADYIMQLPQVERTRVLAFLGRLAESGPPANIQKNRKLEGSIWELKSGQARLLYFFDGPRRLVLTHGYTKKQQKLPRRELDRANRLFSEFLRDK